MALKDYILLAVDRGPWEVEYDDATANKKPMIASDGDLYFSRVYVGGTIQTTPDTGEDNEELDITSLSAFTGTELAHIEGALIVDGDITMTGTNTLNIPAGNITVTGNIGCTTLSSTGKITAGNSFEVTTGASIQRTISCDDLNCDDLTVATGHNIAVVNGNIDLQNVAGEYRVNGTQVVGAREGAIVSITYSEGTGTDTIASITDTNNTGSADLTPTRDAVRSLSDKIEEILIAMRNHGLIAP